MTVRTELIQLVTDAQERAAIASGSSSADHTALIQAAIQQVGAGELYFGEAGWQWNTTASLRGLSGATYSGKARIKARAKAAFQHMFLGTGTRDMSLLDLEFDANTDQKGCNGHCVYLSGGQNNTLSGLHVHDTLVAGIRAEAETDIQILRNRVANCGRPGPSDNHGIMVGSNTAGSFLRGRIVGNVITNAQRKGLAVYCFNTGVVDGIEISHNRMSNCGLGGLYLAADEAMTHVVRNIRLVGNEATDCYVNYEIASVSDIEAGNNDSYFTQVQGRFAGWVVLGSRNVNIIGGTTDFSPVRGVSLTSVGATPNRNIHIRGMKITRTNQLNDPSGAAVYLSNSEDCSIDCDISDSTGRMRYGVLEFTGCKGNVFSGQVRDAKVKDYTVNSSSSRVVKPAL